jgi:hypothetical protein
MPQDGAMPTDPTARCRTALHVGIAIALLDDISRREFGHGARGCRLLWSLHGSGDGTRVRDSE